MAAASKASEPAARDEQLRALHEEIARLPEKFRLAVVLCDLQGLPQDQAAGELRLSERTLRRRLSEGRDRLKARLTRRGLSQESGVLAAVFFREARAAVPAAWGEAAARTALATVNHTMTAGVVSAAAKELTQEVLKIMLIQKLKLVSATLLGVGLLAWGTSAALISREDELQKPSPSPVAVVSRTEKVRTPQPATEPDALDAVGKFPVAGRVVDPDGKLVAGAEIHINPYRAEFDWNRNDRLPQVQMGRVAVAGADGGFQFELEKASSDSPYAQGPAWHEAEIAAVAPGFGPAWVKAGSLLKGSALTLRLVRDDLPIHGRVLDSQGRPVAGASVRINEIDAPAEGVKPDDLLSSGELRYEPATPRYPKPDWLGEQATWTTGADGRFEIKGVGRDRIAVLEIVGPELAKASVCAMARISKASPKPRLRPSRKPEMMRFHGSAPPPPLYGASFEHILGPSKPIDGVVRAKGTNKPVAGVRVVGIEGETWTVSFAQTDNEGRFHLTGLPKSEMYQLRVTPRPGIDPFLGTTITVTDTAGLNPIEATIELPKGVPVLGRLVDQATGRPVPVQLVEYVKLPTNKTEFFNASGFPSLTDNTFRITIPSGGGMLHAKAWGKDLPYRRARLRKADKGKGIGGIGDGETYTIMLGASNAYKVVDVPLDAESFTVDLELARGVTRKGRVVDADGKPVMGAQCYGQSVTWGDVRTLSDAAFEIRGLEPGYPRQVVFAHRDRRLVGWIVVKDEDMKSEAPLEVRLGPAGSIKGRLLDEDGLPLSGAKLSVMTFDLDGGNLPNGPNCVWPDDASFSTDNDGHFQIDGLKPGVKSSISVQSRTRANSRLGAGERLRQVVLDHFGEVRDLGEVKVKADSE